MPEMRSPRDCRPAGHFHRITLPRPERAPKGDTMTPQNTTKPHSTERRAGLGLLRSGLASPAEIATYAGVSRQVVDYWMAADGLNWRKARHSFLSKVWRKALRG